MRFSKGIKKKRMEWKRQYKSSITRRVSSEIKLYRIADFKAPIIRKRRDMVGGGSRVSKPK